MSSAFVAADRALFFIPTPGMALSAGYTQLVLNFIDSPCLSWAKFILTTLENVEGEYDFEEFLRHMADNTELREMRRLVRRAANVAARERRAAAVEAQRAQLAEFGRRAGCTDIYKGMSACAIPLRREVPKKRKVVVTPTKKVSAPQGAENRVFKVNRTCRNQIQCVMSETPGCKCDLNIAAQRKRFERRAKDAATRAAAREAAQLKYQREREDRKRAQEEAFAARFLRKIEGAKAQLARANKKKGPQTFKRNVAHVRVPNPSRVDASTKCDCVGVSHSFGCFLTRCEEIDYVVADENGGAGSEIKDWAAQGFHMCNTPIERELRDDLRDEVQREIDAAIRSANHPCWDGIKEYISNVGHVHNGQMFVSQFDGIIVQSRFLGQAPAVDGIEFPTLEESEVTASNEAIDLMYSQRVLPVRPQAVRSISELAAELEQTRLIALRAERERRDREPTCMAKLARALGYKVAARVTRPRDVPFQQWDDSRVVYFRVYGFNDKRNHIALEAFDGSAPIKLEWLIARHGNTHFYAQRFGKSGGRGRDQTTRGPETFTPFHRGAFSAPVVPDVSTPVVVNVPAPAPAAPVIAPTPAAPVIDFAPLVAALTPLLGAVVTSNNSVLAELQNISSAAAPLSVLPDLTTRIANSLDDSSASVNGVSSKLQYLSGQAQFLVDSCPRVEGELERIALGMAAVNESVRDSSATLGNTISDRIGSVVGDVTSTVLTHAAGALESTATAAVTAGLTAVTGVFNTASDGLLQVVSNLQDAAAAARERELTAPPVVVPSGGPTDSAQGGNPGAGAGLPTSVVSVAEGELVDVFGGTDPVEPTVEDTLAKFVGDADPVAHYVRVTPRARQNIAFARRMHGAVDGATVDPAPFDGAVTRNGELVVIYRNKPVHVTSGSGNWNLVGGNWSGRSPSELARAGKSARADTTMFDAPLAKRNFSSPPSGYAYVAVQNREDENCTLHAYLVSAPAKFQIPAGTAAAIRKATPRGGWTPDEVAQFALNTPKLDVWDCDNNKWIRGHGWNGASWAPGTQPDVVLAYSRVGQSGHYDALCPAKDNGVPQFFPSAAGVGAPSNAGATVCEGGQWIHYPSGGALELSSDHATHFSMTAHKQVEADPDTGKVRVPAFASLFTSVDKADFEYSAKPEDPASLFGAFVNRNQSRYDAEAVHSMHGQLIELTFPVTVDGRATQPITTLLSYDSIGSGTEHTYLPNVGAQTVGGSAVHTAAEAIMHLPTHEGSVPKQAARMLANELNQFVEEQPGSYVNVLARLVAGFLDTMHGARAPDSQNILGNNRYVAMCRTAGAAPYGRELQPAAGHQINTPAEAQAVGGQDAETRIRSEHEIYVWAASHPDYPLQVEDQFRAGQPLANRANLAGNRFAPDRIHATFNGGFLGENAGNGFLGVRGHAGLWPNSTAEFLAIMFGIKLKPDGGYPYLWLPWSKPEVLKDVEVAPGLMSPFTVLNNFHRARCGLQARDTLVGADDDDRWGNTDARGHSMFTSGYDEAPKLIFLSNKGRPTYVDQTYYTQAEMENPVSWLRAIQFLVLSFGWHRELAEAMRQVVETSYKMPSATITTGGFSMRMRLRGEWDNHFIARMFQSRIGLMRAMTIPNAFGVGEGAFDQRWRACLQGGYSGADLRAIAAVPANRAGVSGLLGIIHDNAFTYTMGAYADELHGGSGMEEDVYWYDHTRTIEWFHVVDGNVVFNQSAIDDYTASMDSATLNRLCAWLSDDFTAVDLADDDRKSFCKRWRGVGDRPLVQAAAGQPQFTAAQLAGAQMQIHIPTGDGGRVDAQDARAATYMGHFLDREHFLPVTGVYAQFRHGYPTGHSLLKQAIGEGFNHPRTEEANQIMRVLNGMSDNGIAYLRPVGYNPALDNMEPAAYQHAGLAPTWNFAIRRFAQLAVMMRAAADKAAITCGVTANAIINSGGVECFSQPELNTRDDMIYALTSLIRYNPNLLSDYISEYCKTLKGYGFTSMLATYMATPNAIRIEWPLDHPLYIKTGYLDRAAGTFEFDERNDAQFVNWFCMHPIMQRIVAPSDVPVIGLPSGNGSWLAAYLEGGREFYSNWVVSGDPVAMLGFLGHRAARDHKVMVRSAYISVEDVPGSLEDNKFYVMTNLLRRQLRHQDNMPLWIQNALDPLWYTTLPYDVHFAIGTQHQQRTFVTTRQLFSTAIAWEDYSTPVWAPIPGLWRFQIHDDVDQLGTMPATRYAPTGSNFAVGAGQQPARVALDRPHRSHRDMAMRMQYVGTWNMRSYERANAANAWSAGRRTMRWEDLVPLMRKLYKAENYHGVLDNDHETEGNQTTWGYHTRIVLNDIQACASVETVGSAAPSVVYPPVAGVAVDRTAIRRAFCPNYAVALGRVRAAAVDQLDTVESREMFMRARTRDTWTQFVMSTRAYLAQTSWQYRMETPFLALGRLSLGVPGTISTNALTRRGPYRPDARLGLFGSHSDALRSGLGATAFALPGGVVQDESALSGGRNPYAEARQQHVAYDPQVFNSGKDAREEEKREQLAKELEAKDKDYQELLAKLEAKAKEVEEANAALQGMGAVLRALQIEKQAPPSAPPEPVLPQSVPAAPEPTTQPVLIAPTPVRAAAASVEVQKPKAAGGFSALPQLVATPPPPVRPDSRSSAGSRGFMLHTPEPADAVPAAAAPSNTGPRIVQNGVGSARGRMADFI